MEFKKGDEIELININDEIIRGKVHLCNDLMIILSNSSNQTSNVQTGKFSIVRAHVKRINLITENNCEFETRNSSNYKRESSRKNSLVDSTIDEKQINNMYENVEFESSICSTQTDSNECLVAVGYDYGTSEIYLKMIATKAKLIGLSVFINSAETLSHRVGGIAICHDNSKMPYFFDLPSIADIEKETVNNYGKRFFKMFDRYLSKKRIVLFENYEFIKSLFLNQFEVDLRNVIELTSNIMTNRQNDAMSLEDALLKYLPHHLTNKSADCANISTIDWIKRPLNGTHFYLIKRQTAYLIELRNEISFENESAATLKRYQSKSCDAIFRSNSYQQREQVNKASSLNETQKHHKLASLANSFGNSYKSEAVPVSKYRKVSPSYTKYDKSLFKMVPAGFMPPSNTPRFKSTNFN